MSQDIDVNKLRQNYRLELLIKQNIPENPLTLFQQWFDDALTADFVEPSAMNLATVNNNGDVSSRMVLLKAFDDQGFVFFTNYNSQKAQDLNDTKQAALNIWWDKLYRQIRISGRVEKVTREESVEYFHSRPVGSQLGAIASQQSEVIENYSVLENEFKRLEQKYTNLEIPCPDHWGGYRVISDLIEFWQGRPNRLHDRLRYTLISKDSWKLERLSP